ncbi:SycD/LcrH family type III secretion system chaperone [Comamonas endophytica]|uniref:SycD/LcrH family type III secretion system chaperone n=1 Tax=Comamonas endophytica TaxID=2949090 RepID=A0ABY6GD28_9BURK|nr:MULTISPECIES: SycD/LcrH family type III secretion system chaperone [unclassified Acidovorax]MCD2512846.1 SycD/LcrH family type III secretion system chaperone [Acidovorax sp. D4N7]UYG52806.1 SycD/LcrH family type III secretion system chaperone [Acidovorax sp. 5MLIR]
MTASTADVSETEQLSERIVEFLSAGGTLGELHGHGEAHLESLYALGHHLYSNTRYHDAKLIFGYLVIQNHREPRYTNAYASSLKMTGDAKEAIKYYSISSMLDMDDPFPTFYTAECLLTLNFITEAKEALGFVLQRCDAPQYSELKARAEAMLGLLDTSPTAAPKSE